MSDADQAAIAGILISEAYIVTEKYVYQIVTEGNGESMDVTFEFPPTHTYLLVAKCALLFYYYDKDGVEHTWYIQGEVTDQGKARAHLSGEMVETVGQEPFAMALFCNE